MSDGPCESGQILVRATINLAGDPWPLYVGDVVCVNPDDPHIRPLLIGGGGGPYLVPVDDSEFAEG